MIRYTLKRLAQGFVTVWCVATSTFFVMHLAPGSPLSGDRIPPETLEKLEEQYGLNEPLWKQYGIYVGGLVRGDFGISFKNPNRRVSDIISSAFPRSAAVGGLAITFAGLGGILFGALTARYRNRSPDVVIMFLVILAISVPSLIVAPLVQLAIIKLNGMAGFDIPMSWESWGTVWHNIPNMIVPALVLGLGTTAFLTRLMRATMLEIQHADFVRTARAKGLPPTRVVVRHQLRNAILPVLTVLGPAIASITTGGFVVEQVFSIPGLGRTFVDAVRELDYTLIMGTTAFYSAFLVAMVISVDLLYGAVDPRVRLQQ